MLYYTSECSYAHSLGAAYGGRIPNFSFTASSSYDDRYSASHGRLNTHSPGWGAKTNYNVPNEYLQIDLGGLCSVCGVATQGCRTLDEWTTKFKISLSMNNITWNIYQWNGLEKVCPVKTSLLAPRKNKMYCKDFL